MKKVTIISLAVASVIFTGCDSKPPQDQTEPEKKVQELEQKVQEKIDETKMQQQEEVAKDSALDESDAPEVQQRSETLPPIDDKVSTQASGQQLYVSCIACHGADGQREALGASEAINGWEVERTVEALKGYQDGSYGGRLKASMVGQVANLSDEDIKELAIYINSL